MEQYIGYAELVSIRHGLPLPNFLRPDGRPGYDEHALLTLNGLKDVVRLGETMEHSNLHGHIVCSGYTRTELSSLPAGHRLSNGAVEVVPLLGDLWGDAKEKEAWREQEKDPTTYHNRRPYPGIARPATSLLTTREDEIFEHAMSGKIVPAAAYIAQYKALAESRNPIRRQTDHIAGMLILSALQERHGRIIVFGHKSLEAVLYMLSDARGAAGPVPTREESERRFSLPYAGGYRTLFAIDRYYKLHVMARRRLASRIRRDVPLEELQAVFGKSVVRETLDQEREWNRQYAAACLPPAPTNVGANGAGIGH